MMENPVKQPVKRRKKATKSDLDKLSAIAHQLIVWLEHKLSLTLVHFKDANDEVAEKIMGGKNSLLAMLVVLIDVAAKLEKAKLTGKDNLPEAEALSEADVALVQAFLKKEGK